MAALNKFTKFELDVFKRMRVCILAPIMHVEARWVVSACEMVAYAWEHGLRVDRFGMTERLVVDWARNALAREALAYEDDKGKFTHFLWLDSDHIFNPDLLCQLARHNVDIVGALYYHRSGPPLPVAYVRSGDCREDSLLVHPLLEIPPALVEVSAIGFGAVLMRREIFEKVPEPWFTIDWRGGEDIAFCLKAREYGFKVHLDGAYTIGHIGSPRVVGKEDYEKWCVENPDKISQKIRVQLG